jgi:thioredoxin reductase
MYDVIIVGGGPAGLSAALVLGRCRRRVLVCDAGQPRNRFAEHMHGYLTRDHIEPAEFLHIGQQELVRYGVELVAATAVWAQREADGTFRVRLDDESTQAARKLLLATGVGDVLPEISGLRELYGRSVHHCPYCDGWEHKDERLIALGEGDAGVGLALSLRTWSGRVIACTHGAEPSPGKRRRAERIGIEVRSERITRLVSEQGRLIGIEFESGASIPCDALFFNTGQYQRSPLPRMLGCRFTDDGGVQTSEKQCTAVPGLYLAGDADKDVQFVIVAAAEGATAAVAINTELQKEDLAKADRSPG